MGVLSHDLDTLETALHAADTLKIDSQMVATARSRYEEMLHDKNESENVPRSSHSSLKGSVARRLSGSFKAEEGISSQPGSGMLMINKLDDFSFIVVRCFMNYLQLR